MLSLVAALSALAAEPLQAVVARIEGSSSVAPVIEEALSEEQLRGVRLVPTGTNAGLEAICSENRIAMVGASRQVSEQELAACGQNGRRELVEVSLGTLALVLAEGQGGRRGGFRPDLLELYLALAAYVPREVDRDEEICTLQPNPAATWKDVARNLPERRIRFYGPPPSSASRKLIIDEVLVKGARGIPCLAELERKDPEGFARAVTLRSDGAWLDTGENDAAVAAALRMNGAALAFLGEHGFEAASGLSAVPVGGRAHEDKDYPLTAPAYLYLDPELMNEPATRRLVRRLQPDSSKVRTRRTELSRTGEDETDAAGRSRITRTP
ncbi:substrate-binding domain-containing protein [Parvularcula maris]|uniref:Substrate-binding domain-containing protein n=1 Tax=Parvularcula maris TaxID=2965077 RepID=A0A9X2LBA3_9PROT|nr:substrate-binding domain-containing protein [Parvularcula maris]MCQ8186546.1 substrate-binding domain-containing protein [Parvularcula maris]